MTGPMVILGANGQVGRSLTEFTRQDGGVFRALTRTECDVTDASAIARAVQNAGLLVNCTAYTAVDKAESEPELAFRINADAPGLMAQACAAAGVPLVHLSTDYVFDGSGNHPWREDDPVAPINVYGRSKLAGEEAVRAANPFYVILRTSWVFSPYGANFVRTMRRLAGIRPELRVVADQRGGPTAASQIAAAILAIRTAIDEGRGAWGVFHFSGRPATTWHDFAQAILADQPSVRIHPIATEDYFTPAKRPLNSVLDCSRIKRVYGVSQPDWRAALNQVIARLKEEESLAGSA